MAQNSSAPATTDRGGPVEETPSPRPGRSRAALVAGVILAVLAFHWRAALPGHAFVGGDLEAFFAASRAATADHLRHLDLSSWERGSFMGYPLIGDPQAALFDPATILTLPLDSFRALTVGTLLHLIVMGLGMAFWMRVRGLGRIEAFLAAVLFALGAKQTAHLQHWNFAASTAWWPWMLASVEGYAADGRRRWAWGLAAAGALTWFGGSPQMAYFGTLIAAAYALCVVPRVWARSPGDVLRLAIALAAGMALAAPLLLPAAELASYGPRGEGGLGYAFATSWKWPSPWALALLVLPRAYTGYTSALWPESNLWEVTGYLGLLPLGLIAAAPLRRGRVLPFLVMLVIGVWLSFGEDAWLSLHRILYEVLPGFGMFRVPTRTLMVSSFAGALLAAEGLHALRAAPRASLLVRAGLPLALVAVVAVVVPRVADQPFDAIATEAAGWLALALAASAIAWVALGARWRAHTAWASAALVLVAVDLYATFGTMNTVRGVETLRPALAPLEGELPPRGEPRRVAVFVRPYSNEPQRLRWEGTVGYGPTVIERVRRLVEGTRDGNLSGMALDLLLPLGDPDSPLWPLLATPFAAIPREEAPARLAHQPPAPVVLATVAALPRVYWSGAWVVADDREAERWLRDAASGALVTVATAPPIPSGAPGAPIAAASVRVGRNRLDAVVVAPADGLVVVVDPWFPGWSATVDGNEAPLLRANYAFQAVPVRAGAHRVALSYRNRALSIAWPVVAAGLIAMAIATRRWPRRRAPPRA